ncbi:hypothetical protein FHT72_006671 [Rhizobium sp. BK077]|uniref:hypothetical protein n=1 Tax=unclassified Rhizobium TaxID=2613769 RepID=UPI0018158031|nr:MULTISPECIES: hypothetical protein [unclassified Rhizobium]MBB3302464.1 hypothetical protein [Rhizobium sp. BK112]MBB3372137.1 hypothetical protein [Rhizobium sp. BK077]MBB4182566.1 hypothetical protein [Rhizobium sp. BK109]
MPQSAISSGLIDLALPAEEMGEKLIAFARSFDLLLDFGEIDEHNKAADLERSRERIYLILRTHTGHDFSGYKTKTFLRRVRRRMQVRQVKTIEAYAKSLEEDPIEGSKLFSDLLINVTNFFGDPDASRCLKLQ